METPRLHDLLQHYMQYCSVIRNYSDLTLRGYKTTVNFFMRETGVEYPSDLNKQLIEKWFFEGRLNRKWSSVTFRHYHKHLNGFVKWMIKEEYLLENFLDDIEKPKLETRIPKTLTKDEAQLVLDASYHISYTYKFERYRNRAIVAVMLLAGLRRCEVMRLRLHDVDLGNRMIFVNQGKGAKDRTVPINNRLAVILSEYLQDRKRLKKDSISFFTGTQTDEPIGCKCVNKLRDRSFSGA